MKKTIWQHKYLFLWILLGIVFNTIFVCMYSKTMVDSDMSVEMILADFLNQTKSIISKDFYYTSEIRVFNIQWLYRIGLILFPNQWYFARTVGMFLLYLLFVGALLLLSHNCGLKEIGYWATAASLWPIGTLYWFLGTYGGYYFVYATISIYIVAFCLKPIKKWWQWVIFVLLALLSGLNGVKQMFLTFLPIFFVGIIQSIEKKELTDSLFQSTVGMLVNALGILINKYAFEDYHFYQYLSGNFDGNPFSASLDMSKLFAVWGDFLAMLGYQGGAKIFSAGGIACGLGIVVALLFVGGLYYLFKNRKKIEDGHRAILYFVLCVLLVDGILFASLSSYYNGTYWVSQVPFVWIIISLTIFYFTKQKKWPMKWFLACLSCMILFLSYATIQSELKNPARAKPGLAQVKEYLMREGYQEGYATFWNAHALTELSSGKIDTWAIMDYTSLDGYPWGQKGSHITGQPTTKAFLLLDKRDGDIINTPYYDANKVIYEDVYYIIVDEPGK